MSPSAHAHTRWSRAFGIAIAAAIGVAILVLAFIWPAMTSTARDLPVAITGPTAQVSAVKQAMSNADSPFTLTQVPDRAAAIRGIKDRTFDGGIVLAQKPEVLTASAAGSVVTPIMSQVQTQLQKQVNAQSAAASAAEPAGAAVPPVTVAITDVVPLADTDSRGLGLAVASFPIVIGGMLGGILISLVIAGVWRRLTAAAVYSIAAGFTIVGVMQPWFGILQGEFFTNVAAVALSLFATVAFITGMASLLGRPGIAIGAVTTLLVGNPLSAAAQPQQFIPAPWGDVGQWLVPGASTTLLRNVSYFPDASNAFPLVVLGCWSVFGILLTAFGHYRSREIAHVPGWDEPPAGRTDAAALRRHAPAAG